MKLLIQISFFLSLVALVVTGCQQPGGNNPGSEYMPDMAHSIAYEANAYDYYYNNTWGSQDDYYEMAKPRVPVKGTVPRSTTGKNGISIPANGSVPYYYGDTEEERTRAMNEIIKNPLPITDKGLAEGKMLYTINCGICHGDKGDGAGYLVREADPAKGITEGKYPVQPANFLDDGFKTLGNTNGRFYHSIMYGKNLMGAYKDKLSHDERWNVIHYIRSLQAKDKGLVYTQLENTLNNIDRPAGEIVMVAEEEGHDGDHGHGADGHGAEGHGHDGDHNHGEEGHGVEGQGHDGDHNHEEGHDHDGTHGENHDGDHNGHGH